MRSVSERPAADRGRSTFIVITARRRNPGQGIKSSFDRFDNLKVIFLSDEPLKALAAMAERTMQLTCLVQDAEITISDPDHEATIIPEVWLEAKGNVRNKS